MANGSVSKLQVAGGDISEPHPGLALQCGHVRALTVELRSVLTTMRISAEMVASPRANNLSYRRVYAGLIAEQTGRASRLLEDFAEVLTPHCPELAAPGQVADLNRAARWAVEELTGLARQVEAKVQLIEAPVALQVVGTQTKVNQAARGFLEYLLGVVVSGSTLCLELSAGTGESKSTCLTFGRRPNGDAPDVTVPLDWDRINLAAARHIVEQHGGEVLSGGAGQALVTIHWPTSPEAASAALFSRYASWEVLGEDSLPEAASSA